MKIKISSVSLDSIGMLASGLSGNAMLVCLSCGDVWTAEVSNIKSDSKCPKCGEKKGID